MSGQHHFFLCVYVQKHVACGEVHTSGEQKVYFPPNPYVIRICAIHWIAKSAVSNGAVGNQTITVLITYIIMYIYIYNTYPLPLCSRLEPWLWFIFGQ